VSRNMTGDREKHRSQVGMKCKKEAAAVDGKGGTKSEKGGSQKGRETEKKGVTSTGQQGKKKMAPSAKQGAKNMGLEGGGKRTGK